MGLRVVVAMALLFGVAYADDKPWTLDAQGQPVPQAKQDAALAEFQKGNELFIKDEWPKALAVYLEALKSWDHPNIRYNAAICLMKLDRMVEAYEHMQAAMRYGDAPLGKDLFEQGENYLLILKKATSYIEVICKQPDGVTVSLDGQRLDRCPETKLVAPGKHQIVSQKPGYRTETHDITAPPGGRETVVIVMEVEGTRKITRRWARWKPWAVVGAGVGITLVAVPLWFVTQGKFDTYDDDVNKLCSPQGGCSPAQLDMFDDQLSSAKTWRAITYSTLAVGVTTAAVGAVLVIMNQPKVGGMVVTPMQGDRAGVTLSGSF